jgi:hypothetical protein
MAFASAQQSRVNVALLNASGYAKGYSFSWSSEPLMVATLVDVAKPFILGQDSSTASVDMFLDVSGAANGQWDALTDLKAATTASPVTLGPWGFSVGSPVIMPAVRANNVSATSAVAGTVDAAFGSVSTGLTDVGVVLENYAAVTADGNGTARDNGAATADGGVAHLHVSAFSGLTNNIVTIEHSVDGSTSWATLVTFATYTGATSERVEVAAGTTVRRYLRVVDNVTGTGSTTRFVAFARR